MSKPPPQAIASAFAYPNANCQTQLPSKPLSVNQQPPNQSWQHLTLPMFMLPFPPNLSSPVRSQGSQRSSLTDRPQTRPSFTNASTPRTSEEVHDPAVDKQKLPTEAQSAGSNSQTGAECTQKQPANQNHSNSTAPPKPFAPARLFLPDKLSPLRHGDLSHLKNKHNTLTKPLFPFKPLHPNQSMPPPAPMPSTSNPASNLSPHTILNIPETATSYQIRAAYYQKEFDYHPDRHRHTSSAMQAHVAERLREARDAADSLGAFTGTSWGVWGEFREFGGQARG
ncbi:DnaJ subfamily C member 30, mitochondrial [Lecanora helva]